MGIQRHLVDDDGIRRAVRQAFVAADDAVGAALAGPGSSLMYEVPAPSLAGWRFFLFVSLPHPHAGFNVAVGPGGVIDLTGEPERFGEVLRGADVSRWAAGDVAALARVYIDTTRPLDGLVQIIEELGDLALLSELDDGRRLARDRALGTLGPLVRPARAERRGSSYVATVFVQVGGEVERREIAFTGDGSVTEHAEIVATDLPCVYVR